MTSPPIAPFRLDHFAGPPGPNASWLILGKGPSFAAFDPEIGRSHHTFVLNHAMRGLSVDVGHAIDLEVFSHLEPHELQGVRFLCMPWVPHVRRQRIGRSDQALFGPGRQTLAELAISHPVLARYASAGRLLSYNLCSAPARLRNPGLPDIEGRTFSAAVAMRLLVAAGASEIRTLGVDGGSAYGSSFSDLEGRTKLQTGQQRFDTQFDEMAETLSRYPVTFGPLDAQVPARVFVGAEPEQDLAFQVLAHSIRRRSSISVRVERLDASISAAGLDVPVPAAPANRGRTPFSFQRFHIPRLCGYQGRAVYLDSDMLVLSDLRELWLYPMQGRQMLSAASRAGDHRPPQFSVMLIDCQALPWDLNEIVQSLDAGSVSYEDLMFRMSTVDRHAAALPREWNSLEHHEAGRTRLIHFTEMDRQPWLNAFHPLACLWCQALLDAIADGAISAADVATAVAAGHVRPSLLAQVQRQCPDPLTLPFGILMQDVGRFTAPHRQDAAWRTRLHYQLARWQRLARHWAAHHVARPMVRLRSRLHAQLVSLLSK
ncbi:hypothetical protein [Ramlibacter aurantiacus]|nr:hypothetical protein [Ramlibacter aurantiacus]